MSELDDLARKGAERQNAEERAERHDAPAKPHSSSQAIAALSLSRLRNWWVASKVAAVLVLVVGGILGIAFAWSLEEQHPANELHAYKLGLIACIAGVALFVALPFVMKRIATQAGYARVEETKQWIAGLPFAVEGYLDVVGREKWLAKLGSGTPSLDPIANQTGSSDEYFDVVIALHAIGERPPADFMGKLLDGLGSPFTHKTYRAGDSKFSFNGGPNGAVVARDLHRMIVRMLVPLHERYPMRSVRIYVDRD